jgi:hypothetical protein
MARRERRARELADRRKEKRRLHEARSTPPLELLDRKRREHAAAWKTSAETLERDGDYAWMAGLLGARAGNALAIGTGTGLGTGALLERGWRVVGVDENVAALQAAHARWSGALVLRGRPIEAGPGTYSVEYAQDAAPVGESRAAWIEGDLTADAALGGLLVAAGPFDAVACWLLDAHDGRMQNASVRAVGIRNADEYRLGMQRLAYVLADRVLRAGGVLHVVDRAPEGLSEAAAAGRLRVRDAMARGTSLELLSLDVRPSFVSVRSRRAG